MKLKQMTALILILLALAGGISIYALWGKANASELDLAAVNDITMSLAKQWPDVTESGFLPEHAYGLDYAVLDADGVCIAATRNGLNETLAAAIRNRDTVIEIVYDGETLGKLLLYNSTTETLQQTRSLYIKVSLGTFAAIAVIILLYNLYLSRRILRPFERLQSFAHSVAQGNLDAPLSMDRTNIFGAFTESFDLMREELARAKQNEQAANQSKKELVASLSHDIKTPVASIKAVAEVMAVKTRDAEQQRQLSVIESKADQINTLTTNLFTATLEELEQLQVRTDDYPSTFLYDIIREADYDQKATIGTIPECLIEADRLRTAQVIDNLVSNAYKYGGPLLQISAQIQGQMLELQFHDNGPGVAQTELPLLPHKFYRAENAQEKSGAGLGLYISKYLMEHMNGTLACPNTMHGFAVCIAFRLAS